MTPTPTSSPIFCGTGITTGSHYYTDCCGNFIVGDEVGLSILLDYSKPSNGVTKLNTPSTTLCPTPTPTPTNSQTPTPSITSTLTSTPEVTSSSTPTNTPTPSTTPVYNYVNECNVFTSFPMGVDCFVITQPSSSTSTDGILGLKITGGTSPYSVYWSSGHREQILAGVSQGTYDVLVVDYYGDYSATTSCSLVAPQVTSTPTSTSTPSPTPQGSYPNICFTSINGEEIVGPIQFVPGVIINGKPSYISGGYTIYWNDVRVRWEILNWNHSGIPVSTSTSNVPINSWIILGGEQGSVIYTEEGNCSSYIPLKSTISVENTTCGKSGNCNGSVIISTTGGLSPYSYSINGGQTFQTSNIFNGLCSNTYNVIIKDSSNNTENLIVNIGSDQLEDVYRVYLTIDSVLPIGTTEKNTNWSIRVSPELPIGLSLNFDLNITNLKKISSPGTGIITINNNLYKNNSLLSPSDSTTSSVVYDRPLCSPESVEENGEFITYNISMIRGDIISGTTYASTFITDGQISANGCITKLEQITRFLLSNGTISGCECCKLIVDDRSPQTNLVIEEGDSNVFQ